jgi:2-haloalkanoic acid dehalogenase type II
MASLSDYRILTFDVYGTLIDWEGGILTAIQPALDKAGLKYSNKHLLAEYHALEKEQQLRTPAMAYSKLLATVYPALSRKLGLPEPSEDDCRVFGDSVGHWPAFPDTVDALKRLSKHYKLAVLSNVDRDSFSKTNAGSLGGFPFDLVITAQDVGSYKPDLRNFEFMIKRVKDEFGVEPSQILQTAQSQFHDHHPAKKMGLKSVWIERPGAMMGNLSDTVYNWRFDTLGDMAHALENEK